MSREIDHNETYDNTEAPDPQHGPVRVDDPGNGRVDPVPVFLQHAFFYNEEQKRFEPHMHVIHHTAEDAAELFAAMSTKVNKKAGFTKALNAAIAEPTTSWVSNSIVFGLARVAAREIASQYYRITDFERSRSFAEKKDDTSRLDQLDSMIEEAEASLRDAVRLGIWVQDQDVDLDFSRGANDALWAEAARQTKQHKPQMQRTTGRDATSVLNRLKAQH